MSDVSLITSTYRSEVYLRAYIENVRQLASDFANAGKTLELVVVANDATVAEEPFLQHLEAASWNGLTVTVVRVPRESVYASWNRGVELASSNAISFWGVDDTRYAEALLEGIEILTMYDVVYFPYRVITAVELGLFKSHLDSVFPARPFNRTSFLNRMSLGPFWMTTRTFYQHLNGTDDNFRVCGDFEWCHRAIQDNGRLQAGSALGGMFIVHGDNLSANTNPLKIVEENIVYLRAGLYDKAKPCDPILMRDHWERWGDNGITLPIETQAFLWGDGAKQRQAAWLIDWQRRQRRETLLRIPRAVIEALGLRPLLAKAGLMKATS